MAQKIRLDLSKYKASGVYTIEIDQSETQLVNPQTIRLVIGFSKVGPFNAPVYCPDIKTARAVYGDIDSQLERKGSFFHRTLFTCLQTGPCFALSLLSVNDDDTMGQADKVNYKSLSIDTNELNGTLTPKLYSSFFNKERFWFPATNYFLGTVSIIDAPKFLHFTNLGQIPMSVIVRKSAILGYNLSAKEWYTGADTSSRPAWINDFDYIDDFFVDVIAVEGDWTNYASLATDPDYGQYFNFSGLKKESVNAFLSRPEITTVATITGSIIPDFVDKTGTNQYIQTIVNNVTGVTGLFCAINERAFDEIATNTSKIDMVGHNLVTGVVAGTKTSFEFLSYDAPLINDHEYSDVSYVVYQSPYDVFRALDGSDIYDAYTSGVLQDGSYIIKDNVGTKQYLKFFTGVDGSDNAYVDVFAYQDDEYETQENIAASGTTYTTAGVLVGSGWNIVTPYGNYYTQVTSQVASTSISQLGTNEIVVNNADAANMYVGGLMQANVAATVSNPNRLTRILKMAAINGTQVRVTCAEPIKVFTGNTARFFQNIQTYTKDFNFSYLQGYTLRDAQTPNGSDARMNEILDVMFNTNIADALKSKDTITFRYIVDTFNGGLEPNSKYQLSQLAKNRQKCLAICNTPTITQFQNSTDPRFTDAPTAVNPLPLLQSRYIADGGNLSLNPSFTYSLPDETLGASYVGFFSPNLVLRINNKNLSVPPAGHVSNLFIQKFINGTPFAIVAGPRRGVISDPNLVGVDYDFSDTDRDYLEPFGWNPIIRRKGVGIEIYANNTAFQKYNSALNSLHVRDMLITVEDGVEQILGNYVFEFNDIPTRLEVKTRVDNYLADIQSGGGIASFSTICDTSNNTPEVISQRIAIIDVIIEPQIGMQKFINRVTIVRPGGASSGGFTVA